jgi:hypothetical protein
LFLTRCCAVLSFQESLVVRIGAVILGVSSLAGIAGMVILKVLTPYCVLGLFMGFTGLSMISVRSPEPIKVNGWRPLSRELPALKLCPCSASITFMQAGFLIVADQIATSRQIKRSAPILSPFPREGNGHAGYSPGIPRRPSSIHVF